MRLTMQTMRIGATALLVWAAIGCSPKRIPGTEIDDTKDTRALLTIIERYRKALETRDSEAVMGLVDPSFRDNGGTATPQDDVDYNELQALIADRFSKLENVKVDIEVKKIDVKEDEAFAVYSYTTSFKLPNLTHKTLGDSELEQMTFKRTQGQWKITSGI